MKANIKSFQETLVKMISRVTVVLLVTSLLLFTAACGGGSSSSPLQTQTTPTTPTTPTPVVQATAQGVYEGTTSTGTLFDTIILPNDQLWAIYGTSSGVQGLITGQGKSVNGNTYTANVTDYFFGPPFTINLASVSASFVASTSISGQFTDTGSAPENFSGTPPTNFNYNSPALLSDISGSWSAGITVGSNGSITTSSQAACTIFGTIQPDSSGKNFFDLSLTFGNGCQSQQTISGIAVDYLSRDGVTRQLLGAVATTGHAGFIAVSR